MNIDFRPLQAHPMGTPRPKYAAAKRRASVWRWYGILAALALPFCCAAFLIGRSLLDVSAPGYLALSTAEIKSRNAGLVSAVFVRPGDSVRAGARLFTVSDPLVTARIRSLREELSALQNAQHPMAVAARVPPSAFSSHADLAKSARNEFDEARRSLAQMRELVAEGAATIADAQVAQQRAQAAQSAYLRAQMEAVQAAAQVVPPPPPDTGPTYDQLALAAEIHSLERTIDLGTLRAPFAGRVVSVSISPDSSVAAEQTTMIVEHPQAPRIVAYLAPNDAAAAKIGREAEVDFPGHGVLPAHVLAVTGVTQPSGALETTLTLDKPLPADERIENYPVYVHFPRLAMLSLPLRS